MITLLGLTTIVDLSLLYSMPAMGLWLSHRVLNRYDLTLEGSFCLGGAVATYLALAGYPVGAIIAALGAGIIAGSVTFILHAFGKIEILMGGIVVNTALFSLSLLMVGSHKSIANNNSFFAYVPHVLGKAGPTLVLGAIVLSILYCIQWLLATEFGLVWRATGDNPNFVKELGKPINNYIFFTLAVGNALSALSGALFVHYLGFFSIWSNVGLIVIGLTAVLASRLFKKGFGLQLLLGSLCYQLIIATTLEIDIRPEWHKIIAALLTIILMISVQRKSHD